MPSIVGWSVTTIETPPQPSVPSLCDAGVLQDRSVTGLGQHGVKVVAAQVDEVDAVGRGVMFDTRPLW